MARTRKRRQVQVAAAPVASAATAETDTEHHAVPARGRGRPRRAAASKRQESDDSVVAAAAASDSVVRSASVDSVEVGRRAVETATTRTPLARRDTSGLDLADDSLFGNLDDSFADENDDGDARMPRSGSTVRSWTVFKPRSRQSSVIGRHDHPPVRPSSRGGANRNSVLGLGSSSFQIGAFRRRAREPSILGTSSRKRNEGPRSETSDGDGDAQFSSSDLESEGAELAVAPDAESTPLLRGRRRTRASLASTATAVPQVDMSTTAKTQAQQQRTTRKRKSDAVAAKKDRQGDEEEEEEGEQQPQQQGRAAKVSKMEMDVDSDSEMSDLASCSPQMPPSTPIGQRQMTPVNLEEINAPPASSGSEDEGDGWPDIHTLAKRRRRPSTTAMMATTTTTTKPPLRGAGAGNDDGILSDISSPPSLTHSPNFGGRRGARGRGGAAQRHEPKPLTTADLANLLPRRKYKKARGGGEGYGSDEGGGGNEEGEEEEEEAEIAAEEEEEEEEVMPMTGTRGSARSNRARSRAAGKNGRREPSKTPTGGSRRTRSSRTYGGRMSVKDKGEAEAEAEEGEEGEEEEESESQFQPLGVDSFGESSSGTGGLDFQSVEELKEATKKFKEVDKWELEYEEVAESFSPEGAR